MSLSVHALEAAFRRAIKRHAVPHQSGGTNVTYPGITLAATDLKVSRGHLHRVLTGERKSPPLLARWNAWLQRNPQFAQLQPRR